jgi:hypothetical protein
VGLAHDSRTGCSRDGMSEASTNRNLEIRFVDPEHNLERGRCFSPPPLARTPLYGVDEPINLVPLFP